MSRSRIKICLAHIRIGRHQSQIHVHVEIIWLHAVFTHQATNIFKCPKPTPEKSNSRKSFECVSRICNKVIVSSIEIRIARACRQVKGDCLAQTCCLCTMGPFLSCPHRQHYLVLCFEFQDMWAFVFSSPRRHHALPSFETHIAIWVLLLVREEPKHIKTWGSIDHLYI